MTFSLRASADRFKATFKTATDNDVLARPPRAHAFSLANSTRHSSFNSRPSPYAMLNSRRARVKRCSPRAGIEKNRRESLGHRDIDALAIKIAFLSAMKIYRFYSFSRVQARKGTARMKC